MFTRASGRNRDLRTVAGVTPIGAAHSNDEVPTVTDVERDIKKGWREAEETAKEEWRKSDGITDTDDKVANLGDDVKKNLGNLGDDVAEAVDEAEDKV